MLSYAAEAREYNKLNYLDLTINGKELNFENIIYRKAIQRDIRDLNYSNHLPKHEL